MLGDSLLGILLHLVVDCGIDAETLAVEVVFRAVRLGVLVEPAVELVVGPEEGIDGEILAVLVVRAFRLRSAHVPSQHVPEIWTYSGIMVLDLIGEDDRELLDRVALGFREIAGLLHLPDHEVAAGDGLVHVQGRVVSGRLVDHSHQSRALLDVEVFRILGEESLGRSLDSVRSAAEEYGVEVHVDDLVLGVVSLELDCGDPFLELDPDHLHLGDARDTAVRIGSRIKSLCQLLGNGTASALAGIAHEQCLEQDSAETLEIDSGMLVEPGVLR